MDTRMGSSSRPSSHSSTSMAGSGPGVSGYRSSWKRSDWEKKGSWGGDDTDTLGVSLQDDDGVGEGAGQRVIWDLPHLERTTDGHMGLCLMWHKSAVLRAAGQDIVVVRAPVDIEDRSRVPDHKRCKLGSHGTELINSVVFAACHRDISPSDLTDLREGQHQERSSSAGFNDDCQELWVDGAEGAVPRHLGNANVIVALLGLDRLAEDVAKLTLPHNAATHGYGRGRGRPEDMKDRETWERMKERRDEEMSEKWATEQKTF
ncbi:hypothetical protein EYF80_022406 [Liparis tanakae]|uniref:Uncharacterized protein n=1 Tax=Liparis tanakae TaxID=230148 RepID=A0A4Z2HN89_9TELE|nr:hypothetical protein EYF80_022406 [Liparis tanakae]